MQFKVDEAVWAKIKGYPSWPAVVKLSINKITAVPKEGDQFYKVNFFGEQTHALVHCDDIHKYTNNYEEFSEKKKKRLITSILEANSYVQSQQDSRQVGNELTPPRKMIKKGSRASLPQPMSSEPKMLHMVAHEQPLEVDYKKINHIENEMKQQVSRIIKNIQNQQSISEMSQYFKDFSLEVLNNEELTKTKLPNIIKFLQEYLKKRQSKELDPLIKSLAEMHHRVQQTVITWLTNTDYYESFLSFTEVQPKPDKEKNDFAEKLLSILKKNYYMKKEYSKRIADRLEIELKNEPMKRKKSILKELKKKTIDLKYNRKEKLTEQDIANLSEKILHEA